MLGRCESFQLFTARSVSKFTEIKCFNEGIFLFVENSLFRVLPRINDYIFNSFGQ